MFRIIAFFIFMLVSTSSHAWVFSGGNITIKELVQWEGSSYVLIILSNNNICHAPLADKELYTLILAMYMSGKTLTTYCHDSAETINGYLNSHKLHRLNAT
jgi:hypothetical protein